MQSSRGCRSLGFVVLDGQAVFLDVDHDRYFVLPAKEDEIMRRLTRGLPVGPGDTRLLHQALSLDDAASVHDFGCAARRRPTIRRIAPPGIGRMRRSTVRAWASLSRSYLDINVRGFVATLSSVRRRLQRNDRDDLQVDAVLTAHENLSVHVSSADQCLLRSIALARDLALTDCRCELIFGVKLHPFEAHCWVEVDGDVVAEDPDDVAPFTPILVVP